jgi:hypothetical protein
LRLLRVAKGKNGEETVHRDPLKRAGGAKNAKKFKKRKSEGFFSD